jgi:hypothetical protein
VRGSRGSINRWIVIGILFLTTNHGFCDALKLLGDFQPGWRSAWHERKFTHRPTLYEVVPDEGTQVLKGTSTQSASGLWRMLDLHPGTSGRISWRWKIEKPIENPSEKTKKGDDYAARVFVVFEPHFLTWKTRTICYVWASQQPTGSVYASPYAKQVATIVLESGDARVGRWQTEERDFVADYTRYFKESPKTVSAVALMVDTDNTGSEAVALFDDIQIEIAAGQKAGLESLHFESAGARASCPHPKGNALE